jgi:hypothetical protein
MKTILGAAMLALLLPAQEKTAKDLFQTAVKEAKEKNKRVLLTFGAPG